MLIGEMRDLETTEIAFHAAMTGHLVLSTLHTNSAIATISRLLDMGVDPVLVSSWISLFIAQRLVRKLCQECKQPFDPPAAMLEQFGIGKDDTVFYKAVGCTRCGGTGYAGRMAVHEMLPMTKTVRANWLRARLQSLKFSRPCAARASASSADHGLEKVRAGSTTINEIYRVLQLDEEEKSMMVGSRCPSCKAEIEPEFAVCPTCLASLKKLCARCNQQLKVDWKVCPYCKATVTDDADAAAPAGLLVEATEQQEPEPAPAATPLTPARQPIPSARCRSAGSGRPAEPRQQRPCGGRSRLEEAAHSRGG